MILDSFRQDVRVGLRVLFKEKSFCFLAVLVLGLGIGGATTQFTAVLKGTTTPVIATWTVDLPLVGAIDPNGLFTASAQLGGIVTVSAQTATAASSGAF